MFIKFDDLDMLDFFESQPVSIGEEGEARFIYSVMDEKSLSITMTVDTYVNTVDINIRYLENSVFAGEFAGVKEIKKSDDVLLVKLEDNKRLVIKKYPCLGVMIEND